MQPLDIIHKFYSPGTRLYEIYMAHAKDVTREALRITQKHPELAVDVKFIEEAAMLHDIGIFKTNAPGIDCFGELPYICHGYLGHDLLIEEGYPRHALVCERHTGTGLSRETIRKHKLPLPCRDLIPVSLEEQIICFADKFYSKSKPGVRKSHKRVRRGIMKHDRRDVEVFDKWCEMFL